MKWKNKGHELDLYAEDLLQKPNLKMKYYIFGAGMLGREMLIVLNKYGCMASFIDNNTDKQGIKIEGFDVISLDQYLQLRDGQIIVAVSIKNSPMIVKQLEANLLEKGKDFWLYTEFDNFVFPIVSTYGYDRSYMALAQITLTERCTLKCKKCAHGCYATDHKTSKDLELEQVYESADSFFSKVDFVKEFVLIGGEPLLYKKMVSAIQYIGKKYRNQIGIFSITTNGTILPNEDYFNVCKDYNVLFRISNYSQQIPQLKEKYKRLIKVLQEHDICYFLGNEESEWMDYGFEYLERMDNEDQLIKVFDSCKTPCREVRGNKLYYCVMARSVSDNLGYNVGSEDYLDLNKLDIKNYKKELLEFNLGYSHKGYLDMCKYCHGSEAKNHPIPVAEQME